MSKFIHIRSAKFPVLPGEREELVNEGTYGKALAIYLARKAGSSAVTTRRWSAAKTGVGGSS